jgi:hypothetical protein
MVDGLIVSLNSPVEARAVNCRCWKTFIILPLFIMIFSEEMENAPRLEP